MNEPTIYAQLKKKKGDHSARTDENLSANVSVIASGSDGTAGTIDLPVHKEFVFSAKWDDEIKRPMEKVLGTMEHTPGIDYSVDISNATSRNPGNVKSSSAKLQLVVYLDRKARDVVEELKKKNEEMSREGVKILKEMVSVEEIFRSKATVFVRSMLARSRLLVFVVAEEDRQLAINFETKAKEFGRSVSDIPTEIDDILNALDLLKRVIYGRFATYTSGDSSGVVEFGLTRDRTNLLHESPYKFNFENESFALTVVPGMNFDRDDTIAMQTTCQYSFGVNQSTRIRNYTNRTFRQAGDSIQSAWSEALGAIDTHAIATAASIAAGISQKRKAYVVAHSQGSEICRAAFEFILSMEKIPLYLRRMIVNTTILHEILQTILLDAGLPIAVTDEVFTTDLPTTTKVSAADILAVGDLTEHDRNHIYYQGFGSETYIHRELYAIGSARNARVKGDPVPDYGRKAKMVLANAMMSTDAAEELASAFPGVSLFVGHASLRESGLKKIRLLQQEQWDDQISSPVKCCQNGIGKCFDFARHNWFKNYWINLKIPVGKDVPNVVPKLTPQQYKKFGVEPQVEPISPAVGARIQGKN